MRERLEEAEPCPACGDNSYIYVSDLYRLSYSEYMSEENRDILENKYLVMCESTRGCRFMSPAFDTAIEAVEYWNNTPPKTTLTIGDMQ